VTEQHQPRDLAARCAATCKRGACTGLGSTSTYAHRCQFVPPPPTPPCSLWLGDRVCGARAVDLYLPGWRCEQHRPSPRSTSPASPVPSTTRAPREYGTATTDPLGRDGPLNQYRLPTRRTVGDAPPTSIQHSPGAGGV